MATPPSEANDSRWSRMPSRPPADSSPTAGATRDSSRMVCDQNPKKSAGRLSGARKAVTKAAYRVPVRDRPWSASARAAGGAFPDDVPDDAVADVAGLRSRQGRGRGVAGARASHALSRSGEVAAFTGPAR